jgi:hypothetical protein
LDILRGRIGHAPHHGGRIVTQDVVPLESSADDDQLARFRAALAALTPEQKWQMLVAIHDAATDNVTMVEAMQRNGLPSH